jgi:hypothetical protein
MMPIVKPENHNGQAIGRAYVRSEDGIMTKLDSSSAFHLPSILIKHNPEPLGLLVERAAQSIVSMRAMTTSELRQRLHDFAQTVIANEARKVTL